MTNNSIFAIDFQSDGIAWIGTQEGLARFDGTTWKMYTTSNSKIPGNFVKTVTVDNENNIWIGTNGFGIGNLSNDKWTIFNKNDILGNAVSSSVKGINGEV